MSKSETDEAFDQQLPGGQQPYKSRAARERDLVVTIFGEERNFGKFPTHLHSDFRHLVEMLRRGKQPRLALERLAPLEAALATPASMFKSISELRSQLQVWSLGSQRTFDADSYYDKERVAGYTEHNQGSQEALAKRALQLCSVSTAPPKASISNEKQCDILEREHTCMLAIDLGCGSGLSTAPAHRLQNPAIGAIGVDLSSEMLYSDSWNAAAEITAPLMGERIRCDLAQPLPFRTGVFDVAYSVAAVHYLAQDSLTHSAASRLDHFLGSLKNCLVDSTRPCAFQAFLTREPTAVSKFADAALRTGWSLSDLIIDQVHGGNATTRDFLYLLPSEPPKSGPAKPQRCAMYHRAGGTCALAVQAWAKKRGVLPPLLGDAHVAWLEREHHRFAKRLVRLHARCKDEGAKLDHAEPLDNQEVLLAERLISSSTATANLPEGSPNVASSDKSHCNFNSGDIIEVLHYDEV